MKRKKKWDLEPIRNHRHIFEFGRIVRSEKKKMRNEGTISSNIFLPEMKKKEQGDEEREAG